MTCRLAHAARRFAVVSGLVTAVIVSMTSAHAEERAEKPSVTSANLVVAGTFAAAMLPAGPVTPPALPAMSNDCHAKRAAGDKFRRPLRGLRRAVREGRNPRVLVIGSSSTVGTGASRPANTYVAKLEVDLESAFKGVDFDVFGRGLGGEDAAGQSTRMKPTVEDVKPDLVLWQVGTNDAIGHVDMDSFKACLRKTLAWLADNNFDVVLVDPQYGEKLTRDAFYEQVVVAIAEIAAEKHVLLVDRFEAMRQLARERGDTFYLSADQLHMNDVGHRCMAEQLARAIVSGVLQADGDAVADVHKLTAPAH